MIHEFHLSPRGKYGISCDADGAFVGALPMLKRLQKEGKNAWQPRDCEELSEQFSEHYGLPIDMSSKAGGLKAIANALNDGDLARAQIATVLLGIPDPPQLSKRDRSREQMIKLVRSLHWSGMLKWDPDEHPRWPAGSADGKGGEFAPKGEGGGTGTSPASRPGAVDRTGSYRSGQSIAGRSGGIQLADAAVSDASDDPVLQAARAAAAASADRKPFESDDIFAARDDARQNSAADDSPRLVLAAEGEDERDPRFGIGGNHPPPEELIPQQLQRSPAGPAIQFLDNLLDITGPGDEANLEVATLQMRALLHAIHAVDPNYVYESIEPPGGLAGMSWQGRANVIYGLQTDLAAAIYRVRGDIRPLQEVTLAFMQRTTNSAYEEGVELYNAGKLKVRLSPQEAIGNYVDGVVRSRLQDFFSGLSISTDSESPIRVNNRAYDSSNVPMSYRLPDARVGDFAFDTSLRAKTSSDPQIKGFFASDFAPAGVVIIRPNQLGSNSSYIIWRTDGD